MIIRLLFLAFFTLTSLIISVQPSIAQDCTAPTGWSPYVIQTGDTLSKIGQRVGVSYTTLAEANCIENPSRIVVGNVIFIPIEIPEQDPISIYLIARDDWGTNGVLLGCSDSGVQVTLARFATGDINADMAASLSEMFNIRNEFYGQSGLVTAWYDSPMTIESLMVEGNRVELNLTGQMNLLGACGDARLEGQLLLNIFQYQSITEAFITLNGTNLKNFFNLSDEPQDDIPYLRSDLSGNRCPVPADWFPYEIVRGDTLFKISRAANSNVDELQNGNCIKDRGRILRGQVIYTPNEIRNEITLPLIRLGDNGNEGAKIGCDDSLVPFFIEREFSDDVQADLSFVLERLFTLQPPEFLETGLYNALNTSDLVVGNITLTDDTALINLNGNLLQFGVCADAQVEAQILGTIFQFDAIKQARILLNGVNLRSLFDQSGQLDPDYLYTVPSYVSQ